MKLSIIIPTLNEVRYLSGAVEAVRRRAALPGRQEILVADCGSVDGTAELATRLGVRVVRPWPAPDSRAAALNRGAAEAGGDVLLFLDADTTVPRGYDRAIRAALRDPQVVGGAFEFALDGRETGLRLVELINRVRYRIWPWYYGDQGIFARAAVFRRLGGYPPRRILEASDFCRALGRRGRLVLIHAPIKTSPRRFLEGGIYRVLAHDAWIWWLDLVGLATEHFGMAYQENNRRRGSEEPAANPEGASPAARGNPQSEARNPKQTQSTNHQ
jgi:glycosyltransferase involved in cell wall biosynthesis